MAGLWERVKRDAEDRIAVHFLEAGFTLHYDGTFTMQQLKNGLNSMLQTPLTPEETADLDAIGAQVLAAPTLPDALLYLAQLMAWTIAAEAGKVQETAFRTGLGL
jgi:hypothetical protein